MFSIEEGAVTPSLIDATGRTPTRPGGDDDGGGDFPPTL